MKTEWSLLFLTCILGAAAGILVYAAFADLREQASNHAAKEALQNMSYFKDQKGNCYAYAYQPNTPKFSWIPCELTK